MFKFFNKGFFESFSQFQKSHPDLLLSICNIDSLNDILTAVSNNYADIGITYSFALGDSDALEKKVLFNGEFVVLASAFHPLAQRAFISIDDPSLRHPLILEGCDYPFISRFEQNGRPRKEDMSPRGVDSIDSLFLQVKLGMGIALIPEHTATRGDKGYVSLTLDGVDSGYQIVMFWKKNTRNKVLPLFVRQFDPPER